MSSPYRAAMWLGSWWCHQLPARSPHLWGWQLPLCWRCAGILLGTLALLAWLFTRKRLPPFALCLLFAPLLPLDVLHAVLAGGDGDNARRFMTGLLWGAFGTGALLHLLGFLRARLKEKGEKVKRGKGEKGEDEQRASHPPSSPFRLFPSSPKK